VTSASSRAPRSPYYAESGRHEAGSDGYDRGDSAKDPRAGARRPGMATTLRTRACRLTSGPDHWTKLPPVRWLMLAKVTTVLSDRVIETVLAVLVWPVTALTVSLGP
jgi:hypothetical protein